MFVVFFYFIKTSDERNCTKEGGNFSLNSLLIGNFPKTGEIPLQNMMVEFAIGSEREGGGRKDLLLLGGILSIVYLLDTPGTRPPPSLDNLVAFRRS